MYCSNCGAGIPDDSRFCAECGTPVATLPVKAKEPAAADTAATHEETISSPGNEASAESLAEAEQIPAEAEQTAAPSEGDLSIPAPAQAEPPKSVYESVIGNMAAGSQNPVSGQASTENFPVPESVSPAAEVIPEAYSAVLPDTVQPAVAASASAAPIAMNGLPVTDPAAPLAANGLPVTDPAAPIAANGSSAAAAPAPKKKGKKILLIALIAVVLVVLGAAAFFVIRNFLPSAGGSRFADTASILMISGEDETQVYNGSSKPVTIKGNVNQTIMSMDGTKFAAMADADDEGNSTLYYFDGSKAKKLTDSAYSFSISPNGNTVAYITDYDYEASSGTLNIYDAAKGKSEEVTDDADNGVILSPDGKSYAYISDVKIDDNGNLESYTSYISIDGKDAEPLDSGMQVVALSNSGNYIYYLEWAPGSDDEGKLYVRHGKTDTKIGSATTDDNFVFNLDLSEVMYSNNDKTYFSKAGGDKVKIADLPLSYMIVPRNAQMSYTYNYLLALTYNVRSLLGQLYLFDDSSDMTISYLDGKKKLSDLETISSDTYTFQTALNADGKGLYYLDDSGKIKYYKNALDLKSKSVKIEGDDDILSFAVSPDQSTIYFIDVNNTLWVKHGNSDPVDVADDVMQNSLAISADGKGVYFISDYSTDDETYVDSGTLCYLSNAKDAKPTEIEEEVSSVDVSDFGVVYYVFDEMSDDGYSQLGEAFYSKDGKKFESVMDNAMFW